MFKLLISKLIPLQFLHSTLPTRPSHHNISKLKSFTPKQLDPLAIWFLENKAGRTALTLAASLGEAQVFQAILDMDGVYR